MKGIRFFAALYAAKLATVALSVMHRNGTHMPRLSRQNGQAENNHRHNRHKRQNHNCKYD